MFYRFLLPLSVLSVSMVPLAWGQTTFQVPEIYTLIGDAMIQASAGDVISVKPRSGADPAYHETLIISQGVRVEARAGYAAPVIDADGASWAVEFSDGPDTRSAIVGFRITDFSDVGVAVIGDQAGQFARVENCTIEGGEVGVDLSNAEAIVVGNTITDPSAFGIHVQQDYAWSVAPKLWDNLIVNTTETGVGINLYMNGYVPDVSGNTVVGWSTGVQLQSIGAFSYVERNLVVGAASKGIDCGSQGPLLSNNDSWDNGSGSTGDNFCDCGGNPLKFNISEDPLFCNGREDVAEDYTLKIESPCAEGTHGTQIGSRDVGCAWGTLPDDVTVSGTNTPTVFVLEDLIVPNHKTLTLESGVTMAFDADDESGLGDDTSKNELTVNGTLEVNGTTGAPVTFSGAGSPTEGEWYGIRVKGDGTASLDHATVRYATYGVRTDSTLSRLEIDDCTFSDNSNMDINAPNRDRDVYIRNSSISVGSGLGIRFKFDTESTRVTISGNTITGNSSSSNGIVLEGSAFDHGSMPDQLITGNTIYGFSAGYGIKITATGKPKIYGNEISGCSKAIEVFRLAPGTTPEPYIGWSSSNPNVLTGNTTGIRCDSTGASPRVRYNQITSNQYGLVNYQGATPDLGQITPPTINDPGNNNLSGNSSYCIWNRSASVTLWAEGNYFGACQGGQPPMCALGNVIVTDGLCTSPVSAPDVPIGEVPGALSEGPVILGVRPNPMSAGAVISLAGGSTTERVLVRIYDVSGRLVRDLGAVDSEADGREIFWDGRGSTGTPVRAGLYFIHFRGSAGVQGTTKLLVTR